MKWYIAAFYNLVSALTAVIGMFIGVAIGNVSEVATSWIFVIAAGIFLYVALVDMVSSCLVIDMVVYMVSCCLVIDMVVYMVSCCLVIDMVVYMVSCCLVIDMVVDLVVVVLFVDDMVSCSV